MTKITEFDLSKKLGKKTVTLKKGEDNVINFKNDTNINLVSAPIVSGNDIVLKTYSACTLGYAKVVTTYTSNGSGRYNCTHKYYLYDYNKNAYSTKVFYTDSYTVYSNPGDKTNYTQVYIGSDGKYYSYNSFKNYDEHENYKSVNGTQSDYIDSRHATGTITIKNAGLENSAKSITLSGTQEYSFGDLLKYNDYEIYASSSAKKQTLKGTFLDEEIYGGVNNDIIYAMGGHDTINGSTGADTIYLGKSSSTVVVNTGGSKTFAGDTIHNATSDDTLMFEADWRAGNTSNLSFYQNGNDLVVMNDIMSMPSFSYGGSSESYAVKNKTADKVTIKNYFKSEDKINNFISKYYLGAGSDTTDTYSIDDNGNIKMDNSDITMLPKNKVMVFTGSSSTPYEYKEYVEDEDGNITLKDVETTNKTIGKLIEGKGKLNGIDTYKKDAKGKFITDESGNKILDSAGDEVFISDAKSTITTGHGDDTIYISNKTDTITVNGSGTKTIMINQESGNAIINIKDISAKIVLDINGDAERDYSKVGNDLVMTITEYSNAIPVGPMLSASILKDEKTHTLTFKNYFKFETEPSVMIASEYDKDYEYIDGRTDYAWIKENYFTHYNAYNYAEIYNSDESKYELKITRTQETGELENSVISIIGNAKKANNLTGTKYDDVITGGAKVDTITTGAGDDYIILGKGKDVVTIDGDGRKTINVSTGDGALTVNGIDKSTITNLQMELSSITGSYGVLKDGKVITWSKSNDDLILHYINTANMKDDTITIKKGADTDKLYINDDYSSFDTSSYKEYFSGKKLDDTNSSGSSSLLVGTAKADNITAAKAGDIVYAGAGNDTINVKGNNVTISAGKGNDIINVTGYGNIYAQEGKNTITLSSASSSSYIYSGTGNDTIIFDDHTTSSSTYLNFNNRAVVTEGNDTVRFNSNPMGTVYMNFKNDVSFTKNGNNLLISETVKNAKNKDVVETVTIENYFNKVSDLENKVQVSYMAVGQKINNNGLNVKGIANKKTNQTDFVGSKYNDVINGTAKVDNVTTGDGNDTINTGKGNDIITISGSGTKIINIANGDGNDTIMFTDGANGTAYLEYDSNDSISWDKDTNGSDLILYRTYDNGKNIVTEKTIVKGYFGYGFSGTVKINNRTFNTNEFMHLQSGNSTKKNTVTVSDNGTLYTASSVADNITITSANSEVFAGAGNDIINVNNGYSKIHAGVGDDIVNLAGSSNTVLVYSQGEGNDTINFVEGWNGMCNINANFDSETSAMFVKKGDDLVLSTSFKNGKKTTTQNLTMSDYFNLGTQKNSVNIGDVYDYISIETIMKQMGLTVQGETKNKVTTYEGVEDYKNNYSHVGTGKAVIYGQNMSDNYYLDFNKNSNIYIKDSGSDITTEYYNYGLSTEDDDVTYQYRNSDELRLNANRDNLRLFFNMDKNGNIIAEDNEVDTDSLIIFDKSKFTSAGIKDALNGKGTGYVKIDDFFKAGKINNFGISDYDNQSISYGNNIDEISSYGDVIKKYYQPDYAGDGYIEWMYSATADSKSEGYVATPFWIDEISQGVASWLNANGYDSTYDVMNNTFSKSAAESNKDIAALIALFNKNCPDCYTVA